MPPKRKAPPSAEPPPASEPDTSEIEPNTPSFFNTTFSTHRISPLYIGKEPLDDKRLQTLAKRLRDTLVGDVVRGVQVGLTDDATLGRAGVLEGVELRWVGMEDVLGRKPPGLTGREGSADLGHGATDDEGDEATDASKTADLLSVELSYENSTFSALILPDLSGGASSPPWTTSHQWTSHPSAEASFESAADAFVHLPLLLTRMPVPLKTVIVDFLSRTFDCRISPMRLGTRTLVSSWERWLADSGTINRKALSKDVALTLGFHIEPALEDGRAAKDEAAAATAEEHTQVGLKTIEVIIPAQDVSRFVRAGERPSQVRGKRKADPAASTMPSARRRRLAGGKDEEGWAWRESEPGGGEGGEDHPPQPFMEALAMYARHHLALDMFHPGVRVVRVACDGFVLAEGKVKIFGSGQDRGSSAAVWKLVDSLVRNAGGTPWSELAI